jgi:ribosome-binding protein aMBF1 (putative translation factor)
MQNRIREFRQAADMSMEELANKVGTTKATIMKLEKGDMQLTTRWIEKIARGLGRNPIDLISPSSSRGEIYRADEELMQRCAEAIMAAAKNKGLRLDLAATIAYTTLLYNHVMEYRRKGQDTSPNEPMAALILKTA